MITLLAALAVGQATSIAFDVTGYVSELTKTKDGSYQMLVSGTDKPVSGKLDKAMVRATAATEIVDVKGRHAGSYFRERVKVGVTFSGPVAESYPVQATAKRIVVLSEIFDAEGTVAKARFTYAGLHFSIVDAKGQAVARVTTDPGTIFHRMKDGKQIRAERSDLKDGVTVEMSYQGAVALSYPPQGKAGYILLR